ncbi:MAG: hypothetical protein GWP70_12595 [Proteobacteria bacterium]|nr:hypothetical protein [Pseudomonadota bacterium]
MKWKIWIWVPIVYALFAAWYFNWQGPLSDTEIESFMRHMSATSEGEFTDQDAMLRFLREDDGREFIMLNQVELREGAIPHPLSGVKMPASEMLYEYFGPFTWALLLRGGHPVFQARSVGSHVDTWNANNSPTFAITAMMRYRSRRDVVQMVLDPAFTDGHKFKLAAIQRTISYPTQIEMNSSIPPHIAVLVLLLLLASLAQNLAHVRDR